MKRILVAVLAIVGVAIVAVLGIAATKPDTFHVERRATIAAPPATVYAQIEDFRRWPEWSPWEKLDPNMQRTFSGSPSGVDAVYAWAGNSNAGEGRMTITETEPNQDVEIKLDFIKPWESTSQVQFKLAPVNEGTEVLWTMDGNFKYMEKVMCVFMDMDKMVGKDFEAGLANLKRVAESAPPAPADTTAADTTAGQAATH